MFGCFEKPSMLVEFAMNPPIFKLSMDIEVFNFSMGGQFHQHPSQMHFWLFYLIVYRWYHKVQMDEQVYMNLWTIKQNVNESFEEYYEHIMI